MNRCVTAFGYFGVAKHLGMNNNIVITTEDFEFEKGDLLILEGGSDVDPSWYGQKKGKYTSSNKARDKVEFALVSKAIAKKIPILGICRGAQLLCVAAGGTLIQHVSGHVGQDHVIEVDKKYQNIVGHPFNFSTCHHQMMFPWKVEHELIAWVENRSHVYLNGDDEEIPIASEGGLRVEPEVVYFPQIRALAIQGHPEFMPANSDAVSFTKALMENVYEI